MKTSLSLKLINLSNHGGNIYLEEFQTKKIIDFSASINPLGISKAVVKEIKENIKYCCHYPDPQAKQMRLELARHLNIDDDFIVCGNGSTELIYLAVQAIQPKIVLIFNPTFSEYERAVLLRAQRARIKSYTLSRLNNFDIKPSEYIQAMKGCDMAFLCNPNNPTGRLLKKDDVLKIADASKKLKCYLIVDEAFIDFTTNESAIEEVKKNPYLIVLRSMTKFYALSGLRVGYGVFPSRLLKVIRQCKDPWSVNTLAQIAAIASIKDKTYKEKTLSLIKKEKKFLEDQFKKMQIDYIPSSANYYLMRLPRAKEIISSLKDKGILVRDCSNFKGLGNSYIRISVRSRKENMKLIEELKGNYECFSNSRDT